MTNPTARAVGRLVFILCSLSVSTALWAQNENENVGFRPGHVFESGHFGEDLDTLNGGINLSVPIGQRFLINSRLGYGLTLSYNSKVWDATYYQNNLISSDQRVVPSTESPFGIGFNMTLGRIFEDFLFIQDCGSIPHNTCFTRTWTWISPDGAHHEFFFDSDEHSRGAEDGVLFDSNGVFQSFTNRVTTDLSYAVIRGPGDQYCVGAKDDGTPETGCMRVETPDGLVYTLAKRVDCVQPPLDGFGFPTSAYQQIRTNNRSFCGWYTKYIEDPSLGSRGSSGTPPLTTPYPNNVQVAYDTRPNFQHAIASITDSATRTLSFHNCEWWSGGHCSGATTQACNGDSQCTSPQVCYTGACQTHPAQNCSTSAQCPGGEACVPIQTTSIADMCMAGSKDPASWTASDRSAVATYAVDVPSFANSTTLSPATKATFGFMYEYTRIRRADYDLESTVVYTPTPVLKLLRLDYPGYTRPGQSNPDLYSLYYGYYNNAPPIELASGGSGDYGEVTCRTLPLLRKAGTDPTGITGNACAQTGSWASFKYSYGYYFYVGKFMQASQHGSSPNITGMSRQMVTKELQLPSGSSSGQTWRYKRDFTSFTNPIQVTVSDPLGNDTVYHYHASQSSDNPNIGPGPSDGYAPEWNDGSNSEIDYYRGTLATGALLRSESQEQDSDLDPLTRVHSKSNVRVKHSTRRYVDAGSAESIVSRDQWDGYGHWQSEVESGFGIDVPRRTTSTYQNGAQYVYITGLLRSKEVTDGQRVLSRSENEYDAYGRLTTSIARLNLPASIGTPVTSSNLSATAAPGDVLTLFSSSTASGNILSKTMSTGRLDDPTYDLVYKYAPSAGNCTAAGECGGYLANKTSSDPGTGAVLKTIDRDRDANTGLILATRDPAGVQTNYTYDALGRLTQILPAGEESTQIAYESLTRTTVTQGTPGASDLDPATNFIFTRYIYDGLGRQVAIQKRPANPNGLFACQKTQYDVSGQVVYKTEWTFQSPTACDALPMPPQNQCTAYSINSSVDPGTEFDYSEPGAVPSGTASCDPFGRVRLEIPADGDRTTGANVTRTDYSGLRQDVTVSTIHDAGGTATYSAKTSFIKDAFDRLITVDSPPERRCIQNDIACTSDAQCGGGPGSCAVTGGADAYYTYDLLDRLTQAKLSNNLSQTQIRRFDYDSLGRVIWADNPESGTTVYERYDALGNPMWVQYPNGNGARFRYDFASRISEQDFWFAGGDGSSVSGIATYAYDHVDAASPYGNGKLYSITRYKGAPSLYQFFQEKRSYGGIGGRLSSTTHSFYDWYLIPNETTNYTYDTRGQLTSIQYPQETPPNRSILTVNYAYSNGMVVTATEGGTGTVLGSVAYNAAGGVATVLTPGGGASQIAFDTRNRPSKITIGKGTYDSLHDTFSGGTYYQSGAYGYDGAGNIFQIGANRYGYDAVNRLITAHTEFQGNIFDETFFYDPFGNMDSRILATLGGSTETELFTYSNPRNNRIMTRQTSIGSSTASAVNFVYDATGNLLQGGRRWMPTPTTTVDDVKKYQYDPLNHLTRIQQIGNTSDGSGLGEVNSFEYDASGNRLWKVEKESGIKTYYLRDPSGQVLSEFRTPAFDTSSPEWASDYVYLAGRLMALKENLKPRPPLNLSATQAPGSGQGTWRVTLSWDENGEADKSYYKVYRKVDGTDTSFVVVSPPNQPPTATYADPTDFAASKTVHYKVSAVDTSGYESNLSLELKVVTADSSGPPAPTLSVAEVGDGFVRLSWTIPTDSSDIVGYEVDRRLSTGNNVPSLPITGQLVKSPMFTDYNLTNGQTYYYRVKAKDAAGNWGPMSCQPGSICDVAATPVDLVPPPPPKGLTVSSTCGSTTGPEKINLSWEATPPSGSYTVQYDIFRDTAPIYDYRVPALTPITSVATTSYQDPATLTPGTTYFYALKANYLKNGSQIVSRSPYSKCVAGKVRDSSNTPKLQIFAKATDGSVTVSWQLPNPSTQPSPRPSQYLVYRKLNASASCSSYVQVGSVAYSSPWSIVDSGVPNNFAYDYAISAVISGVESSFSKPTLAIPLTRPSGFFQCAVPDPWTSGTDDTAVQWLVPTDKFYQPFLASTADGTYFFLKGYHLYHYKLCGKMLGGSPLNYQDNSPTREIVTDSTNTIDPYLIYRGATGGTNGYVYQDPRYPLNSNQVLSPQFNGSDTDNSGVFLFGDCNGNDETNCVMPKAVYKVFAAGTWLSAESDWPDYFDTLATDPALRCKTILHDAGISTYPKCADGRTGTGMGDPNYVPPPRKVTATSAGPGAIRLDWVPPVLASGRPPIAGYYLYARRPNYKIDFKHPLPFATAGPNETTMTLTGLAVPAAGTSNYEFSVASFDTSGRVSNQDFMCEESGQQCTVWSGCPGGSKFCDNTKKLCSGQADCSYGFCTVSLASCSATGTCPVGVCSNNHSTVCTPIRYIRTGYGSNISSNSFTVDMYTAPANGNALIAVIGTRSTSAAPVTGISQPGANWGTAPAVRKVNGNGVSVEIWYALNVSNANRFLTISLASGVAASAVVVEYSGIVASGALDVNGIATNSNNSKNSSPSTGTSGINTSQGNEIWVGGMANVDVSTYSAQIPAPPNGFTERLQMQSGWVPDSTTRNNTVFYDWIQTATGTASVAATLSAKQFWAGAIATFKTVPLESTQCGAGYTCLPQTCDPDICTGESCQESIGRWCTVSTSQSCSVSSDCPLYRSNAKCNISQTACDPTTTPDPCAALTPAGQVCAPGEVCRNVVNSVQASPGAETAVPAPPASLKTVLWTLNDSVLSRKARTGVRLAWSAVSGASGYRVYRSATPEGPFCALLHSGATPSPVLPAEAPTRCTSDVTGRTVDDDAAINLTTTNLSTTGTSYWDQTVANDKVYYYKVTTVNGSTETPMSAAYEIKGRELAFDKTSLPPPQGFRAWASQTGGLVDKGTVILKWCSIPTVSSGSADVLPSVDEYRVYRTGQALTDGTPGAYRLLARLSPLCLNAGYRCEILPTNACVDSGNLPRLNADGTPNCPVIGYPTPSTACNDTTGPRCAIADHTFISWPRIDQTTTGQYPFNYRYFVTALGTLAPNPQTESMPSVENSAWLNYCGTVTQPACTSPPTAFSERRDPDGNGEYLVCGNEDARLMKPDGWTAADGETSMTEMAICAAPQGGPSVEQAMAPHRIIGQSNPYTPPARFIFYHLDHLGSPRVELDSNGSVVAQHHFLPFGEERPPQVDPTLSTRDFTGHERDKENGLDYMLARYYSSSLGRFLAVDPGDDTDPENPQSWNKYSYVRNNPVLFHDPDGRVVVADDVAAAAAVTYGVEEAGSLLLGLWVFISRPPDPSLSKPADAKKSDAGTDKPDDAKKPDTGADKKDDGEKPDAEADKNEEGKPTIEASRKPYEEGKPGRKKQSRELREKKRKKPGWKPRHPPKEPKKHTPSKEHQK